MNSYGLCLALVAVAVVGLAPAHAQLAGHVVINEVETNPPGNDAASISEWVELYNPTTTYVDLNGWEIASTITKKSLVLQPGTILGPGQLEVFQFGPLWLSDLSESVELRSPDEAIVDKTPILSDSANDFSSWQKLYDGYAPNTINNWKFVTSGAGSSNGKLLVAVDAAPLTVNVSADKEIYRFGEAAVIRGNVSEIVDPVPPLFKPEPIMIAITGPDFTKNVIKYPDAGLDFDDRLTLQRAYGIGPGTYDISVTYSGATATASFEVKDEVFIPGTKEALSIGVETDRPTYIPGQTVSITATASKVLPSEVLQYEVTDPDGGLAGSGNLFSADGVFETGVFITTVNPVFGEYEIKVTHGGGSATATYEVVKSVRGETAISLATNQTAYGLGDAIVVTGQLNEVWVGTLDLSINQAKIPGSDAINPIQITSIVRINGDGSFAHSFVVPNDESALGDYLVQVTGETGSAKLVIPVVEDPANYVKSDEPLTMELDSSSYEIGQTVAISGYVLNPFDQSTGTITPVTVSIFEIGVGPVQVTGTPDIVSQKLEEVIVDYSVSAIPQFTGGYQTELELATSLFNVGSYALTAKHLGNTARATFDVSDQLASGQTTIEFDKGVYGLGQTATIMGVLPDASIFAVVDIELTKPDGGVFTFKEPVLDQRFEWTWEIPATEKSFSTVVGNAKDVMTSNLGIYKIHVSFDSTEADLFFKVSLDPENDSPPVAGLTVSPDMQVYDAGDTLSVSGSIGTAKSLLEGTAEPIVLHVYKISPYNLIHTSDVFAKPDGGYSGTLDLPATLFDDGSYGIRAKYADQQAVSTFEIGSKPGALLISADEAMYLPGSLVDIIGTGGPDSGRLDIGTIRESDAGAICGVAVCGSQSGIRTSLSFDSGSFAHEISLPDSAPLGTYEVLAVYDSFVESATFEVVEEVQADSTPRTIIEKENRITEKEIAIEVAKKEIDGKAASPRVVSGSMVVNQGAESAENLRVVTESGICIIGPGDCLVSESTRKTGQIYEVVEADGVSYNVRYSGPDVRLEKFSIVPEDSEQFLPDSTWDVTVDGGDSSRFYYKITYKTS